MVFGRLLRGNSTCSTEASSPKGSPKCSPKLGAADPAEDIYLAVAEQEWELVEPENAHLVIEDYNILGAGAGEAGAGAARAEDQCERGEVASRDAPVAAAEAQLVTALEDEEPCFRCRACRISIFKPCDVISANYHAQSSPGYLIGAVKNTRMSPNVQTVTYTTGQFSVQDVFCQRCSAMLGVTYTGTDSVRNQYKVGKYLMGIDRLVLPKGTWHPMEPGPLWLQTF